MLPMDLVVCDDGMWLNDVIWHENKLSHMRGVESFLTCRLADRNKSITSAEDRSKGDERSTSYLR